MQRYSHLGRSPNINKINTVDLTPLPTDCSWVQGLWCIGNPVLTILSRVAPWPRKPYIINSSRFYHYVG